MDDDFDPNDPLILAIQALRYDPNAEVILQIQPVATLKWTDEMPADRTLIYQQRPALYFVYSIFGIRKDLWKTGRIDPSHLRNWTTALAIMPEWPLFRRLELSPEDQELQRDAEEEAGEVFEWLEENSSEFHKSEDRYGLSYYKAILDRVKRRILGKPRRGSE